MILGARRLGLGQGGRRAAHVEATNDRGGKGAGGERQRRDGRTSARGRRRDVRTWEGDTDRGTPTEGRRRGGRRGGAGDVRAEGDGAPHACEGTDAGGGRRRRDIGERDATAAWETSARGHRETSVQGAVRPREDRRGRGTPAEGRSHGSCPGRASPHRDGGRHGRRRPRRIRVGDAGVRGWA